MTVFANKTSATMTRLYLPIVRGDVTYVCSSIRVAICPLTASNLYKVSVFLSCLYERYCNCNMSKEINHYDQRYVIRTGYKGNSVRSILILILIQIKYRYIFLDTQ